MIKVGVVGGAGYTAGELLRILIHHPEAEIVSVMSGSHTGEPVFAAHPDLEGSTRLLFSDEVSKEAEVVFLCSGHGKSRQIIADGIIPEGAKIIDLSSDYRLKDGAHDFVYGLPELNRRYIEDAKYIANPGCFATCIQLCLLPLAFNKLIKNPVHVTAITGSTGAGQNPTSTTHFSWRSNNASVYKAFTHQHLAEIKQSLNQLQADSNQNIHFIPMRGAFTRGILAACYTTYDGDLAEVKGMYHDFYAENQFVTVSESQPDVKRVANTNNALVHLSKEGDQLLIIGVIDNLLKGASGQAIQNMNLMFGLPETTGLNLKSSAF